MATSFLRSWFGDFSREELKKFFFLGMIFIFTIGIYWFLRTSKDGVFNALVGIDYQPIAKWVSMFFIIPLTMFYGFLVDRFPRHKVFYALSSIYGIAAVVFSFMLANDTYGLANATPDKWRLLGWAYYLFVESFGSIMVMLFWTFASDTTSPESAKRGFPLIAMFAQFGAFLGSAINSGRLGKFAVTKSLMVCALAIAMIPLLIFIFMKVIPQDQLKAYGSGQTEKKSTKPKVGFLEGFRLVFSQPYLLGIFFSITIYEVITTLFDFKFKALIGAEVQQYVIDNNIPLAEVGALKTQLFNEWVGWMGEWSSILAIASILLGIGNIGRFLGITIALLILPMLLAGVALLLGSSKSVLIAAIAVIIAKGINYALYQPTKEQLFIPTSKETKYKAKAFVDMFGSRSSKALGSLINMVKIYAPVMFPIISMGSSLALCAIWLMISLYLGRTYERAVSKNEVVC